MSDQDWILVLEGRLELWEDDITKRNHKVEALKQVLAFTQRQIDELEQAKQKDIVSYEETMTEIHELEKSIGVKPSRPWLDRTEDEVTSTLPGSW